MVLESPLRCLRALEDVSERWIARSSRQDLINGNRGSRRQLA